MTLPLDQQVVIARQIWIPALKELKRSANQRAKLGLSDEDVLAIGTFACCELGVQEHGTGAFEKVRSLVDALEAAVLEAHRNKQR